MVGWECWGVENWDMVVGKEIFTSEGMGIRLLNARNQTSCDQLCNGLPHSDLIRKKNF